MATQIPLDQLYYPNPWVRESIMHGDWPELLPHQWAILAGHPIPYMPWEVVLITREEYEAELAGRGVCFIDRYLQQSMPKSVKASTARQNDVSRADRRSGLFAWLRRLWRRCRSP